MDYSLQYSFWHQETPESLRKDIQFHQAQLRNYLPKTTQTCSVLDIGCGMGRALLALKELGFEQLTGVDQDLRQVEAAVRAGVNAEKVDNVLDYLRSRPEGFDLVLLLDVLEHIPVTEQLPVMRAIHGALRPGGRVIVQVPNASWVLASRWRYIDFTHWSSFTEHSLGFVLKNAGFPNPVIPAEGRLRRPRLRHYWRLWKGDVRHAYVHALRRWFVRAAWNQVIRAELGPGNETYQISLEPNLIAMADKPVGEA